MQSPSNKIVRRRFIKTLAASAATLPFLSGSLSAAAAKIPPGAKIPDKLPFDVLKGLKLTRPGEILKKVAPYRALAGGKIPADLKRRLGCTHVSGQYAFTKEPFLIEGAKKLQELDYGCLKLWFTKIDGKTRGKLDEKAVAGRNVGYMPNSEWNLPPDYTLKQLAQHPYFVEAFAMPFSTFALEVYPTNANGKYWKKGFDVSPDSDWAIEEREIYELAKHLLETYRDRDVTFILQNWEGDWMFRGGAREAWRNKDFVGGQVDLRAKTMINWFAARQRGVEKARAEVKATRCRVWHAAEVNRVFDALNGTPTLTTQVLPYVKVDLLSWSCYDGMRNDKKTAESSAIGIWQGIEIMQHCAAKTTLTDKNGRSQVMLGEIGVPENRFKSEEDTRNVLDGCLAACFAIDMQWIIYWELFCNEISEAAKAQKKKYPLAADELNGFWLIRPDGSMSWAGKYLDSLLKNAGGKLT